MLLIKMFPNNGEQTTTADGEVKVEEKGKKERNWKDEEKEVIIYCFVLYSPRGDLGNKSVSQQVIALYDCFGM